MKIESSHPAAEFAPADFRRPTITASFSEYKPPFAVVPVVQRLLDSVPPRYLAGLEEIVLTNTANFSRSRRRSVTKSRKRKVRQADALGLYHQAWQGKRAWIEIFVENVLAPSEGTWRLRFRLVRELLIGNVLFHEIGHHIHYTSHPEFREKENVADNWNTKLRRNYYRRKRPVLGAVLRLVRPFVRWFSRKLCKRLYAKGAISQAQMEQYLADSGWEKTRGPDLQM